MKHFLKLEDCLVSGKPSTYLRKQLDSNEGSAGAVYSLISKLENNKPSHMKNAGLFQGDILAPLKIYHHHVNYKVFENAEYRFLHVMESRGLMRDILTAKNDKRRAKLLDEMVHGMVFGKARKGTPTKEWLSNLEKNRATGQWLIYKIVDGVSYYLCVVDHINDSLSLREDLIKMNCFNQGLMIPDKINFHYVDEKGNVLSDEQKTAFKKTFIIQEELKLVSLVLGILKESFPDLLPPDPSIFGVYAKNSLQEIVSEHFSTYKYKEG